jgi:hypothetical protein
MYKGKFGSYSIRKCVVLTVEILQVSKCNSIILTVKFMEVKIKYLSTL